MKLRKSIKVLLLVMLLLLPTGCVRKTEESVPCVLLKCTDFSSEEDAYDNGVIKEICGKDCVVE
jgi:hypothetical protein